MDNQMFKANIEFNKVLFLRQEKGILMAEKRSSRWVLTCLFWFISAALLKRALGADVSHLVGQLPGQPTVGFKQYAGHVTVNATAQKALFYWFYEADHRNSSSLPLVLWLSGGPGCSSVGAGALSELGPFRTNDSGTGLTLHPYAWNKAANMIFLESPHGVGFSYSNSSFNESHSDEKTAADNLLFLLAWLSKFPEYSRNDFYITGESYAGHYIPTLATHILAHNNQSEDSHINLKGFAIGNPWTVERYEDPGNLEFFYTHSIISAQVYNQVKKHCYPVVSDSTDCGQAQDMLSETTLYIDHYNVYATTCNLASSKRKKGKKLHYRELLVGAYNPCLDSVTPYMNLASVQAALNVDARPMDWSECSGLVNEEYSSDDVEKSMLPLYRQLFKAGIKIWIYSGDVDSVVSTISTKSWIQKLNLTVETPWYAWNFKDQVGGWTQVYSGLTFTTVRGSGHMAPFDKPGASLAVFESFLQGKPLPPF